MKIAIIGVGLIGGSLAIDAKELGFSNHVIGVDLVAENLDKALRRKIIDVAMELVEAIKVAEVIILATPVDAMLRLLPQVLDLVTNQVVFEMGSSKVEILATVEDHRNRKQLVSLHPMAGTEFSGPEAALPRLFANNSCVVVDAQKSSAQSLKIAQSFLDTLSMNSIEYTAKEHDLHVAYISHISHLSSFSLALTVLAKEKDEQRIFELASGGFSSTVRLAKSSAKMWVPIFKQNRTNLLDVLDEHINSLAKFRTLLIKSDFDGIEKLIHQSNEIKRILQ